MDKIERFEIRLSGTGGQGLVTAGIILAHAAIIEGRNAVQTQVYGPESRGGACRSEVIIADATIDYPQVTQPDICLVMSQESYNLFADDVKPGGTLVVDSTFIKERGDIEGIKVFSKPITEIVKRRLNTTIVANVVALTILSEVVHLVKPESLLNAIFAHVPQKFAELNENAFQLGRELAEGGVRGNINQ